MKDELAFIAAPFAFVFVIVNELYGEPVSVKPNPDCGCEIIVLPVNAPPNCISLPTLVNPFETVTALLTAFTIGFEGSVLSTVIPVPACTELIPPPLPTPPSNKYTVPPLVLFAL